MVGAAIVTIATGKCIGKTYGTLVMPVHVHQLHQMAAEQTLLGLHPMKLSDSAEMAHHKFSTAGWAKKSHSQ